MSTYKIIATGKEAREKLAKGANALAQPVVATLGPRSRNVVLNRSYPAPAILHDGVSVAKAIRLKDPFEDMGAVLLKEAASKTNDLVGDGTTTATLLANTLIQKGMKLVEGGVVEGVITGRVNAMELREELAKYSDRIIEQLDKKAVQLKDKKEWAQVASVSAASKEIGDLVADAFEHVGKDGIVMVENSPTFESSVEVQEGYRFDNGYMSPYFVTDADRMVAEYTDGYILLTDFKIADPMQLVPLIEKVMKGENKPLLIIADDVLGVALQSLVVTKLKIEGKLVAVTAPEFADRRREALDDLAVLTGGVVISQAMGGKLEDVEIKQLGRFRSIEVGEGYTSITPKTIDQEELQERIDMISKQIDGEANEFKKAKLQDRLFKLSGKVAIINVGGHTEAETVDKRERFIDAVYATKAALAEGIIPGGGVALRDIANGFLNQLEGKKPSVIDSLVYDVLVSPILTILENAGHALPEEVLTWNEGQGINVMTNFSVMMLEEGIADPVKVTKLAVRHAFSIAANMLTTEVLVSDDPDEGGKVQKVHAV